MDGDERRLLLPAAIQKIKPFPRRPPVRASVDIVVDSVVLIGALAGPTPHEHDTTSARLEIFWNIAMKCASLISSGKRTATSAHPGATPTTPVPFPSATATPRHGVP